MLLSSKKLRIFIVLITVAFGAGVYWFMHLNQESTDDAHIHATIVSVSPKVPGYVKELHIETNMAVKAGDVLLQIDPHDYEIKHDRSTAAVDSAQAQVDIAQANRDKAAKDLERVTALGKLASSRQQVDEATTADKATAATLLDAQAKLATAKAELAQTEKDLGDTKLVAPMNGQITKKGVELGDYVQTGQQLAYLVADDAFVIANFKETQLTDMRIGQKADIEIDMSPGKTFHGTIQSFQLGTGSRFSAFPAENATGNFVKIVQRVPVKILFDAPPEGKLHIGPGMSAIVTVHTK